MATIEPRRYGTDEMLAVEKSRVLGLETPEGSPTAPLHALCLSGGGIRSASFCLGVLQALAEARLLRGFHYLSTVSGGGYIGGWLQRVISEQERNPPDLEPGERELTPAEARIAWTEEELRKPAPRALRHLRDNTNFLTPHTGIGSADTWAGIVLYLRNLMLNWLILGPVFMLAALLPIIHRTGIWWLGQHEVIAIGAWVLGTAALAQGVLTACRWLPSHCTPAMVTSLAENHNRRLKRLLQRVVGGALLWACVMPVLLEFLLLHGWSGWLEAGISAPAMFWLPAIHVATMLGAYLLAWALACLSVRREGQEQGAERRLFLVNLVPWVIACLGAGACMLLALVALYTARDWLARHGGVADLLTLLGPLALLGLLLAQTTFYLGLRRQAVLSDLDKEWLARVNGIILGCGAAWTLFAAACLIAPRLTLVPGVGDGAPNNPNAIVTIVTVIGTAVSGFLASGLGKQVSSQVEAISKGPASAAGRATDLAMRALPLIFIVALFGLLSTALHFGLGRVQIWWTNQNVPDPVCWSVSPPPGPATFLCKPPLPPLDVATGLPLIFQLILAGMLILVIWRYSTFINVNRFSMHATYRNRLTRAFLGTPRFRRTPDPLTGFDHGDDPRLKEFDQTAQTGQRLFPVINMTMNVTAGARGAWAERKGASFIATPLFCGAADLDPERTDPPRGAFVPTRYFAGKESEYSLPDKVTGTRLGSMITVSGAAASPHWGYHSSPVIAFLMTLFNVRLGAWYPNPARVNGTIGEHDAIQIAKPTNSLKALLEELTGTARADSDALYLSDGGHFENLGVYEMLRRKCRCILVVDAGQDSGCTFFDLGMMIRKAEIDLQLSITMRTERIAGRTHIEKLMADSKDGSQFVGFAYGDVTYLDEAGKPVGTGEIIYMKPSLCAGAPTSVWAYARDNPQFPHESTGDQYFSESQFESYRTLGRFQARQLLRNLKSRRPDDDQVMALCEAIAELFGVKKAEKPGDAVD